MPTYEYECEACGAAYEREQRITEDAIKKCMKCGKMKAKRLIGTGNFILKGGGWYSDLYSGSSNSKKTPETKTETAAAAAPAAPKPAATGGD